MPIQSKTLKIFAAMLAVACLWACSGMNRTTRSKEIAPSPCQEQGYSDAEYFRGNGSGKDLNEIYAREKALLLAKQNLAGKISSQISSVTELYAQEAQVDEEALLKERFTQLIREVVNRRLQEVEVTCDKTYRNKNNYETFIAVQIPKRRVKDGINLGLGEYFHFNVDQKSSFEEIFDREMRKTEP